MTDSIRHKEIDPLTIATWLDGRSDAGNAAAIEAALAADPLLLDAALAARDASMVPDIPSKETMKAVISSLPFRARPAMTRSSGSFSMAFAATVVLGVAIGGFGLGRGFEGLQQDFTQNRADQLLDGGFSLFEGDRR